MSLHLQRTTHQDHLVSMLCAIRALSVLLCVTLVGDGHLQNFTSPCQSHLIVPLQIFIVIRIVLAVSFCQILTSSVADRPSPQIYTSKSNKTLAVAQNSHPILKLDLEPVVTARGSPWIQKEKEDIEQRLRTVYQRANWLETELSALQDVHASKVTLLASALANARTLRFRSMGRKINKGYCIKCNVKRRSLHILNRVKKTSHPTVAALLSRDEELEKRVIPLRIGIYKLTSGVLGHSGPSLALDEFALTKVNFEDIAALRHPVDSSNPGPSPPSEATTLASLTYANASAESESQNGVKGRYLTLSLGQTTEDNDDQSESEDRSLDEAPTPAILSLGVFEELAKISSLTTLDKGRLDLGALSPLSEIFDSASFCVATSTTYCANACLTDAMRNPSNVFTNDEMATDNIVTSLGIPHQSLESTPSSLSLASGPNELTSVGFENATLQSEKQWDTDYMMDTMRLRMEGETLSSVTLPNTPAAGEAVIGSSEADTSSFSVYSASAQGLDSLCDSNLSSMLSRYFKEVSSLSAPWLERPLEAHPYEDSRINLSSSGADINTNDMQSLGSRRPIVPPYSSVSTMIGLGIRNLQSIGCKGEKPFACLLSTYNSKSTEPRALTCVCVCKGAQKGTPKVTRNTREALANIENCEIEYIE